MAEAKKKIKTLHIVMGIFTAVIFMGASAGLFFGGGYGGKGGGGGGPTGDLPDYTQYENFTHKGYNFYIDSTSFPDSYIYEYIVGERAVPIQFRLDPRNADFIDVSSRTIDGLKGANKVYLTYNPNQNITSAYTIALFEVRRILSIYKIETVEAFTEDSDPVDYDIPLKTCEDATTGAKVLVFNVGSVNKISDEDNCVTVEAASPEEIMDAADKIGYNLIGVKI